MLHSVLLQLLGLDQELAVLHATCAGASVQNVPKLNADFGPHTGGVLAGGEDGVLQAGVQQLDRHLLAGTHQRHQHASRNADKVPDAGNLDSAQKCLQHCGEKIMCREVDLVAGKGLTPCKHRRGHTERQTQYWDHGKTS